MKITSALSLAAAGFRVFPLFPNSKKPATPDGYLSGTTNPKIITAWWTEDPDRNIGVATGGEYFVVDADAKDGKKGLESLALLDDMFGLPTSRRVVTPTDGVHVYLAKDKHRRLVSNAGKVDGFPDIDIRAEGGYVVGPGSTIDGKPYAVAADNPLAPAPEHFFPLLRTPIAIHNDVSAVELDLPEHIERAVFYLAQNAPQAIEGAGGNETTFSVAAELRAKGIAEHTALDLMLEHWNEQKASPPWAPDELATVVANAYKYGQGPAGGKTAAAEFGDLSGIDIGTPPSATPDIGIPSTTNSVTLAQPYRWAEPIAIPKREWLLGKHLIRKFVSVTVAPGNIGKSSLAIAEAIEMVTGRNLIGHLVEKPLRVWYWNLEDPYDELQRRIQAACQLFGVTEKEIEGRLFVNSGRDTPLRIAVADSNGAKIVKPVVQSVVQAMRANEVDVLVVDPFVSSHGVSENDNMAIDLVAKAWGKVADATNAAIELIHHTRKAGNGEGETTTESARGGKALTDAARDVRVLNRMSKEEGTKAGVENHRLFFRTYSDKANMAPPADRSEWFKLDSVSLANGDEVGVVTAWDWPDPFAEITGDHLRRVQQAIDGKEYRESVQAKNWVGRVVGEIVGLNPDDPAEREKLKSMIRAWVVSGGLRIRVLRDEKGKERPVVEVGNGLQEALNSTAGSGSQTDLPPP